MGDLAERFPLAGDGSGAVATYEYAYKRSGEGDLNVGAKAFGVDIKLKATVELSNSITVTFGLVAGSDYELHRLAEGNGLDPGQRLLMRIGPRQTNNIDEHPQALRGLAKTRDLAP